MKKLTVRIFIFLILALLVGCDFLIVPTSVSTDFITTVDLTDTMSISTSQLTTSINTEITTNITSSVTTEDLTTEVLTTTIQSPSTSVEEIVINDVEVEVFTEIADWNDLIAISNSHLGEEIDGITLDVSTVNLNVVGEYEAAYTYLDASEILHSGSITIFVVDTVNPEIVLKGEAEVIIEVGETYVEPGATCHDNYDELSSNVLITGEVNSEIIGQYIIRYNYTDSSGNEALEVIRKINVVDSIAPVIVINGESTVVLEVDQEYIEAGASCLDNYDEICTKVTISGTVDTSIIGEYLLRYNYSDLSGNEAVEVTRTVMVVDVTPPQIKLNGEEAIELAVGTEYFEQGATCSDNYDEVCSEIIISGEVDFNLIGDYVITYNYSDSSGNEALEVTRTISIVDLTPPIIIIYGEALVIVEVGTEYVEAGAYATDNYDESCGDVVISGEVDTSVLGEYFISYNYTDDSGNSAEEVLRSVKVVDTTVPTIFLIGDSEITIEAGYSYEELGAYVTDNYDHVFDEVTITGAVNTSQVGVYQVTYNYTDSNNNAAIEVVRIVIVQDTTPPELIDMDVMYLKKLDMVEISDESSVYYITVQRNFNNPSIVTVYDTTKDENEEGYKRIFYNLGLSPYAEFGQSMALSGNFLAVGISDAGISSQGLVYIYDLSKNPEDTGFKRVIQASDYGMNDGFGECVALVGKTLIVSAPYYDYSTRTNAGIIYFYNLNLEPGESGYETKYEPRDLDKVLGFGEHMSFKDGLLVLNASVYYNGYGNDVGAVYVYSLSPTGTSLRYIGRILSPVQAEGNKFGYSIATYDHKILIGEPYADESGVIDVGKVYLYDVDIQENQITLIKTLLPPKQEQSYKFGLFTGMYESVIFIGTGKDLVYYDFEKEETELFYEQFINVDLAYLTVINDRLYYKYYLTSIFVEAYEIKEGYYVSMSDNSNSIFYIESVTYNDELIDYPNDEIFKLEGKYVISVRDRYNNTNVYEFERDFTTPIVTSELTSLSDYTLLVNEGIIRYSLDGGQSWNDVCNVTEVFLPSLADGNYRVIVEDDFNNQSMEYLLIVDSKAPVISGEVGVSHYEIGGIYPSEDSGLSYYGDNVKVFGSYLVITDKYYIVDGIKSVGAVYVFDMTKTEDDPDYLRVITPSVPMEALFFGVDVDMDGNRLIVGANGYSDAAYSNVGCVYLYDLSLEPSDLGYETIIYTKYPKDNMRLGNHVSIYGNYIIVGDPGYDDYYSQLNDIGAVHIFNLNYSSTSGLFEKRITLANFAAYDYFGGYVIAIEDGFFVSAHGRDLTGTGQGAVYKYSYSGNLLETIIDPEGAYENHMGRYMYYYASKLYIYSGYGYNIGEVLIYDFTKSSSDEGYLTRMRPPTTTWNQFYGHTFAVNDQYMVVSAPGGWGNVYDTGVIYVYDLSKSHDDEGYMNIMYTSYGEKDDELGDYVAVYNNLIFVGDYHFENDDFDNRGVAIFSPETGYILAIDEENILSISVTRDGEDYEFPYNGVFYETGTYHIIVTDIIGHETIYDFVF